MGSGIVRGVGWLVAFLVGAFYGTAATVGHAYRLGVLPVGLVLATLGCAALLIALRVLTQDRVNAIAAGLGIIAATFLFSQVGPGGSAIIAAPTPDTEWIPLAWTLVGPILLVLIALWPEFSPRRPEGARES